MYCGVCLIVKHLMVITFNLKPASHPYLRFVLWETSPLLVLALVRKLNILAHWWSSRWKSFNKRLHKEIVKPSALAETRKQKSKSWDDLCSIWVVFCDQSAVAKDTFNPVYQVLGVVVFKLLGRASLLLILLCHVKQKKQKCLRHTLNHDPFIPQRLFCQIGKVFKNHYLNTMVCLAKTQKEEVEGFGGFTHPAFIFFYYRHVNRQISWIRLCLWWFILECCIDFVVLQWANIDCIMQKGPKSFVVDLF